MHTRRPALLAAALLAAASVAEAAALDVEEMLRRNIGRQVWYGVYMGKEKAGYALTETVATKVGERDAVEFRIKMRMKLTTLGRKQDMRVFETRTYLRTGEFHGATSRMKGEASDVEVSGVVQGGKMVVTSRMGELANSRELAVPKENLRDHLAVEQLLLPEAKPGQEVTVSQFEPLLLKEISQTLTLRERKTITFNGVPTEVSVIQSRVAELGVTSDLFVDKEGVPIEFTVSKMFTLRVEPEKQAKDVDYTSDLLRMGCVRLAAHPKNVAKIRAMRFEMLGIDDPELLIDDRRQKWADGANGARIVACQAAGIEAKQVAMLPVDKARFAEDMKATMFAQADDERVRKLASEIVGEERNAWAAAKAINHWVYTNIRKAGTAALSNAVETLQTREGDCTEHTVLFVALARAAGIPTREVAGVSAIEGGEGLYFHAWPEVWVGEWVATDPTLGQDVADATHIKFAQGGVGSMFRITGIFGRLKARILAPAAE